MPSSKKKLLDYDINNVDVMKGKIDKMLKELFPITRSITGDGVRQTYKILNKIAKFKIYEIPTGKKCYDWIVPKEWVIKDAYVEDELTLKFRPSNYQGENIIPPDKQEPDINQTIV